MSSTYTVYSQKIVLEGKIISEQNIDIEGINIYNLTAKSGVISDDKGNFRIPVSLNDSLSVSAVHVEEIIIVIDEEQMKYKKITIDLTEKMNLLNTVTVRRPLTGYLASDANIIPLKEINTATSVGLPNADLRQLPKSERMLYTATSGPLDFLINSITGETKRIKMIIELEQKSILTESIMDKLPLTFFTDVLKIPTFKVYTFMFFCEDDPDYKKIMKRTQVEIIEYLRMKSKEFLREQDQEDINQK